MFEVDGLLVLLGIAWSLIYAYIPPLADAYEELDSRWKPLVMALSLLSIVMAKMVVTCQFDAACWSANWQAALVGWVQALIANQGTYMVAVRQFKKAKVEAKEA